MRTRFRWLAASVSVAAVLGAAFALRAPRSHAADHLDPPSRTDPANGGSDRNADIADVFAWHRGAGASQSVVLAMSFSGPNAPVANQAIPCDRGVIYTIHIDNTGDGVSDRQLSMRLGQDDRMNCFARWEGLPGTSAPVVTRAERLRDFGGGVKAYVGLRDDAFFFDLQGFRTTLMTGTLSFVNDRDFFARKNTPVMVIEVPATAINNGMNTLRIWGTTARRS